MTMKASHPNQPADEISDFVEGQADLPEWLVARRSRQSDHVDLMGKINNTSLISPDAPIAFVTPKRKKTRRTPAMTEYDTQKFARPHWLVLWISSRGGMGYLFSLLFHSIVLLLLAFMVISNAVSKNEFNLTGVLDEGDELGAGMVIDTSLPVDAGESRPLPLADMVQTSELNDMAAKIPDTIRLGFGGKGRGEGESGAGTSIGVASLKVPGHAQTKGSFTAWSDPRDPKPRKDYVIVIQIRLPSKIKKYDGSDLSGLVIGTDGYRQVIDKTSFDPYDVENGSVEIRIPVPGGAQRVRDTIEVKSKVLGEKQKFEIEF